MKRWRGDVAVVMLLGAVIFAVSLLSREWRSEFRPAYQIDLSFWALPRYAFFSVARGSIAYCFSLVFTFVVGYAAAKSEKAERIVIPMLDILQSVPVLGFLPALVLGLIAVFPRSNIGLELAAILMIFTGQVWNMTFSFYNSLKSVPTEWGEASRVMGLNWKNRLIQLELPFSAVNLAWNSLLSMAGGWFFLSVCEAFTLGKQEYRLPGVGAYIAVATSQGNVLAMIAGMVTMVLIIIGMDFFIWRPVLVWAQRFRLEERPDTGRAAQFHHDPFVRLIFKDSRIFRWVRLLIRKRAKRPAQKWFEYLLRLRAAPTFKFSHRSQIIGGTILTVFGLFVVYGFLRLTLLLHDVSAQAWWQVFEASTLTLLRVLGCLFVSSLWTVPLGIWIARSSQRVRTAQPILQVLASFPAPMLYPLALGLFFALHIHFEISAMFLMMLGAQWYILFNVLAGALRIPNELRDVLSLCNVSRWQRWVTLDLPAVFPALVTGWLTAAGGAWNASIVAEYLSYRGKIYTATGLGSTISQAAERGDFQLLAASIAVMVALVILFNRTVWSQLYKTAQLRFRLSGQ